MPSKDVCIYPVPGFRTFSLVAACFSEWHDGTQRDKYQAILVSGMSGSVDPGGDFLPSIQGCQTANSVPDWERRREEA